jgi:membrane-associated phospholipid phosphatase
MPTRRERLMPFFFISLFYGLTVYFFSQRLAMNDMIVVMLIAVTVLIFLIFLITTNFKISVHSAASWGVFGCLLSLNTQLPESPLLIPVVVSVILAGIVSSARLYLNAHTPREVYAGLVLGFAVCFGILYFAF